MRIGHPASRRLAGTLVAIALSAGVAVLPAGTAAAAPSIDPADGLAARVVQLDAQITAPQEAVAAAQALAAIALDDYQAKQAALQAAQDAAQKASAAVTRATDDLGAARTAFLAFVRRSYISGSTSPGAAALVMADPTQYVERTVLLHSAGAYRSHELDRYAAALQQTDRTKAAAQAALDKATTLGQQASAALATAQDAEREARREQADLSGQQGALQAQREAARQQLVALVGEQEAARRIARAQAAAAASAAGSASSGPVANPTTAGRPNAAVAAAAMAAARRWLGTPYSWGGGGSSGPSYGIDPDAAVIGFDCSGLTQYAYAQAGVAIPRNAQAQFSYLPKVSRDQLQAGDLVFWATDPRAWQTIHHVALYLGDGTVLQAPESGDVIKISPMWWSGYAGAVRPSAG